MIYIIHVHAFFRAFHSFRFVYFVKVSAIIAYTKLTFIPAALNCHPFVETFTGLLSPNRKFHSPVVSWSTFSLALIVSVTRGI